MPPCDASIEVTLRSIDGLDDFTERKFVLTPNVAMPIGRSSKNANKKLMSAADNVFIDSPVISREHARLSASNAMGVPTIYLTDNGSMHGTLVNNQALTPKREHKLHNGDTLQFGANIVRDQDSFIAKKYRFQSQILPVAPAVSHGFSVPEAESEEEEEEEQETIDEEALRVARYGTQTNPVNVDDFEDVPQEVIDLDNEMSAHPEPASPKMDKPVRNRFDSVPEEPRVHFSEMLFKKENKPADEPALQFPIGEGHTSEADNEPLGYEEPLDYDDEDESHVNPFDLGPESPGEEEDRASQFSEGDAESEDEDNSSNLSQDGSMNHSDDDDSGSESGEDQELEDSDALRRHKIGLMLNHEHQKEDNEPKTPVPVQAQSSPQTAQATTNYAHHFPSNPSINFGDIVSPDELSKGSQMSSNIFGEAFGSNPWEHMVNPLPPRPAAPKPSMWGPPAPDFNGAFMRVELNHNTASTPWFQPPPATTAYPQMSAFDSRPTRMDYLGQVLNSEPTTAMSILNPHIPALDEANPTASHTNRRTKVSIPEIVEDTPQQPPTPTSVGSPKGLKRKADVLDEEETEIENTEASLATSIEAVVASDAVRTVAEEPPAKRRRTLALAASNLVSFIAGGVFVVGALVMLPEIAFS